MFASVNTVYQIVKRLAAKEEAGFISPTDFNFYAPNAQQKLFQSILSEYRMFQMNSERYLNYFKGSYNSLEAIQDDLMPLRRNRVALSGIANLWDYPDDYAYFIDLDFNGKTITVVDVSKRDYYVNAFDQAPSEAEPVAIRNYNNIEVLPATIGADVNLSYYKTPQGVTTSGAPTPAYPNWAYTVVSSKPVYNATDSVDFELPKHLEYRLATIILLDVGVSLREADVFQMAQAMQQGEIQEAKQ